MQFLRNLNPWGSGSEQRPKPTPVENLIADINKAKAIKDLAGRFGTGANPATRSINIQGLNDNELADLAKVLYDKVLFLSEYHKEIPSDQKDKYYNYFHALFSELSKVCNEIDSKPDAQRLADSFFLNQATRTAITNWRPSATNEPAEVLRSLLSGHVTQLGTRLSSAEFKSHKDQQQAEFSRFFAQKTERDLLVYAAVRGGLLHAHDAAQAATSEQQAFYKDLAEKVLENSNDGGIKQWFKDRTPRFLKSDVKNFKDAYKRYISDELQSGKKSKEQIKKTIDGKINEAYVRALCSLRGTSFHEKLTAQVPQPLASWEELMLQKRTMKYMTEVFEGKNSYEPLHKKSGSKTITFAVLANVVGLFVLPMSPLLVFCVLSLPTLGLIQPLLKERLKDIFIMNSLNFVCKVADYTLKPVNFVVGKVSKALDAASTRLTSMKVPVVSTVSSGIVSGVNWCLKEGQALTKTPVRSMLSITCRLPLLAIEAPFKLLGAVFGGIFNKKDFDPDKNFWQRIGEGCNRLWKSGELLNSSISPSYDMTKEAELVHNPQNKSGITTIASKLEQKINEASQQHKTQGSNTPQKDIENRNMKATVKDLMKGIVEGTGGAAAQGVGQPKRVGGAFHR